MRIASRTAALLFLAAAACAPVPPRREPEPRREETSPPVEETPPPADFRDPPRALAEPGGAPIPGGVAAGGTAFLRAPGGGVEARRLADGRLLWSAAGPASSALPVAVVEGDLLAMEPDRLVRLRGETGDVALRSDPLGLPAGVSGTGRHEPRGNQEFACAVEVSGGRATVRWRATTTHVYGMRPPAVQATEGAVAVDLGTGRVEPVAAPPLAPGPPEPPEDLRRAWEREGGLSNLNPPIWTAHLAALVRIEGSGGGRVAVLRRWELPGGRALEPVPLPGRIRENGVVIVKPGLDGTVAAVARPRPDGKRDGTVDLYDLAAARLLARLPEPGDYGPFLAGSLAMAGEAVLLSEERVVAGRSRARTLRVHDRAGRVLWEAPLWAPPEFPPVAGAGFPGRG